MDRVIILSRMLREVITVKVPFEQRPDEVREQAMGTFGRNCSKMREQQLHIVRQECVWHFGKTEVGAIGENQRVYREP